MLRNALVPLAFAPVAGAGELWFMSLMRRDVPVELVCYPRLSHGLSRTGEPWWLVDRLERLQSWFSYWLIEQAAEPTMSQ